MLNNWFVNSVLTETMVRQENLRKLYSFNIFWEKENVYVFQKTASRGQCVLNKGMMALISARVLENFVSKVNGDFNKYERGQQRIWKITVWIFCQANDKTHTSMSTPSGKHNPTTWICLSFNKTRPSPKQTGCNTSRSYVTASKPARVQTAPDSPSLLSFQVRVGKYEKVSLHYQ